MKKFWNNYKYDICCMPAYVLFFTLIMTLDCNVTNWKYWVFLILVLFFRWIGYKEGRVYVIKLLLGYKYDIDCDINDERVEPVVCELKDISQGIYFSLLNDNTSTKYIKCDMSNEGSCVCWDVTENKTTLINNDTLCIVYKTKIIYIPLVKMKEDK